jgi:deoxycytidine triphosphate deaminase
MLVVFRRALGNVKIVFGGNFMGILCDSQIRELIGIEPFEDNVKRPGKISYGVSSYGYDLRVGSVFKIFTNVNSEIVDPKKFSERSFVGHLCWQEHLRPLWDHRERHPD